MIQHLFLGWFAFVFPIVQVFGDQPIAPGATTSLGGISKSSFTLKGEINDLQWLGGLTQETVIAQTGAGAVYRSTDDGRSWQDVCEALKNSHGNAPCSVEKIVTSPVDRSLVFLIGQDLTSFVSEDGGQSWSSISTPSRLTSVELNPTHSHRKNILAIGSSNACKAKQQNTKEKCHNRLYHSADFGKSWFVIASYVEQASWLSSCGVVNPIVGDTFHSTRLHIKKEATHELSIIAVLHTQRNRHQRFNTWDHTVHLVRSDDLFKTQKLLMKGGNRFLMSDSYMFIAKVEQQFPKQVFLQLSSDCGNSFYHGIMPFRLQQHSYTVLDTSENQVMLHVNHAGPKSKFGNVYISDAIGLNYTLSLKNNVRDENGRCDFEKIQGLEGVYLANYVTNSREILRWNEVNQVQGGLAAGTASNEFRKLKPAALPGTTARAPPRRVRTVITFDKGGTWDAIPAPNKDAHGAAYPCATQVNSRKCNLHLHGVTSRWGPMYSVDSATGLILATGNVGQYLSENQGDVNTYFSRDGGREWFEIRKGSRIYELGDHGGLIVMADDIAPTTHVEYSWDEGLSWESFKFSDVPMTVSNIVIEPTSRGKVFLVYGTENSLVGANSHGKVHTVDFGTLHTRSCEGMLVAGDASSDYELWSPNDGTGSENCLLGHQIQYTRRKRTATCYNPMNHERKKFVRNCACSAEDYECDFGYYRVSGKVGPCVKDPSMRFNVTKRLLPQYCPRGTFYTISNGYRKVAGDTCEGGEDFLPSMFPCPSHGLLGVSASGWMVLSFVLVLLAGMCAVTSQSQLEMEANLKAFGTQDFGDDDCVPSQVPSWRESLVSHWSKGKYQKLHEQGVPESPFHYECDSEDDRREGEEEGILPDPVSDLLPIEHTVQPAVSLPDSQVPKLTPPPSSLGDSL